MQSLLVKNIEEKILDNWVEYQHLFVEFQSKFLTGLYFRYKGIENGNLALYYARETHHEILRKKDYDLDFNLSYEKLWKNHSEINPRQISVIKIATETHLPKETTRRKILQLVKQKVLNKKNSNIGWLPNEQYKKNYNLFINEEITDVTRLINFVSEKINLSISKEEITKELKEKFSFYWFHYLSTQLKYFRLWSKQIKDLELVLILLQVANLFISKARKKNLSHKSLYDNPNLFKEFMSASISATSISEVTTIPRATCVRKLETLVKLKIILKDPASKRYYFIPDAMSEELISRKITEKVVRLFSEFYFICLRALKVKPSN
ncbi:hypothetical protein OAN67_00395 [Pelagibacteraceae bacterium]|jgi:Fic family protein|nr:hypothetical protein [Pelagibacteraceae bacterium]